MGREIKCRKCNDIIRSKFRHDLVECKCKAIYIDGGDDYTRIGGEDTDILLNRNDEWISLKDLKAK